MTTADDSNGRDCIKHGCLQRGCARCFDEAEIAYLTAERDRLAERVRELEAKNAVLQAVHGVNLSLCPCEGDAGGHGGRRK